MEYLLPIETIKEIIWFCDFFTARKFKILNKRMYIETIVFVRHLELQQNKLVQNNIKEELDFDKIKMYSNTNHLYILELNSKIFGYNKEIEFINQRLNAIDANNNEIERLTEILYNKYLRLGYYIPKDDFRKIDFPFLLHKIKFQDIYL